MTPGTFSGRYNELVAMERALFQTKNGNPLNFLIHGERGKGKSSLLFYLQVVTCGDIDGLEGSKFSFLTVSVELEPSNDYTDTIQKIGAELRQEVAKHRVGMEVAKAPWDFLKRWEVMGVKYDRSVGSDAEAKRKDRRQHESRTLAESPQCIAKVAQKSRILPLDALILASLTEYRKFDLSAFPERDRGNHKSDSILAVVHTRYTIAMSKTVLQ